MAFLNSLLGVVFDTLLYPFRGFPPLVGLVGVSLVASVAMLWVFGKTSNQAALLQVKRRIHAGFFEIRLFQDDLRNLLGAQADILRANFTYLRLSLIPLLWMIVPFTLAIAQLHFHYGYRGLVPGESVLLKVELEGDAAEKPRIEVEAPPELRVRTPSVWIPSLRTLAWRVTAAQPGHFEVGVWLADGSRHSKTVEVSDEVVRCSPIRPDRGWYRQLLYPAEAPLPDDSAIRSIRLEYPAAEVSLGLFGWRLHWMVVFFVLTLVFAFALRKRLGVTI